jgi:DNA polymerase-3 subunit delta'
MTTEQFLGHQRVVSRLHRSMVRNRLASTYLFVGPSGVGKRTLALKLAQALLCEAQPTDPLGACRQCTECRQAEAQTHPDLILVQKPPDRNSIPVELLIGDREHRMREGLCHDISLKPFRGRRKVAVIDDADSLYAEGANCLLKTLEEPPANSLLILIGTSEHRQLPTIRSRAQIVRFGPLPADTLAQLLLSQQHVDDPQTAQQLAAQSNGSLQQALQNLEDDTADARQSLVQQLAQHDFDSVQLIDQLSSFVDAAGKEAPARRLRLHRLVDACVTFYHGLMRLTAGQQAPGSAVPLPSLQEAADHWTAGPTGAAQCLERCLEAKVQIDSSANLSTLIAAWIDDLTQASRPPQPTGHSAGR